MRSKLYSLLVLFFLGSFVSIGQTKLPPKLKFHSLKVEDGLPNNTINAIVQDSLGFIWIGTNDGLCRYDGKSFKYFKESPTDNQTISNNYIQSLFVDKGGDLWIMTDQGLNRYDPTTEQFKTYLAQSSNGLSYNSVTKMIQANDGSYYIGSYGGGIDVFDGNDFTQNFNAEDAVPISSNLISDLQLQNEERLWVGTWDSGISSIDLVTGDVRNYDFGANSLTLSGRINSIYLDRFGFLWISTDQGLSVLNTVDDTFFRLSESNCKSLVDDDILVGFEDSEGQLWFGTRNSGIMSVSRKSLLANKHSTKFTHYAPNGTDESVNHRSVSSLYEDREGNIWAGTHQGGINIVNPKGETIRYYSRFSEETESEHQSVWGVSEGPGQTIWVGTDGEGLLQFDPITNSSIRFLHDPDDPNTISDNAILTATQDSKHNLWLGTYAGGISKLMPGTNKFKRYRSDYLPRSINSDDVRVIFEDSSARIWIGSNGGGLQLYHEETDDFEFIQEVGWLDIRAITEDNEGVLWLGTYGNGLLSYDASSKVVTEYPELSAYNSHIIFSLLLGSDNKLWIGSRYKGLLQFDIPSRTIKQFTENEGLSNNTIQAIVEDGKENLWISTNDGLNRMDVDSENIVSFKNLSGVQTGQFNQGSGFLSDKGYLVFGGINGLNVFYPEEALKMTSPSKILFTDFKLFNESVKVSNDSIATVLTSSISEAQELSLAYNENDITINYIALGYPNNQEVKYAYKLANLDQSWNFVGNTTSATYRNLSPGAYTFMVRVVDDAGKLSKHMRSINLIIEPPIWFTWPAILIYILLGGFMIYMAAVYYSTQVKLRNSLFYEKKLRQKETDLNQERFRFFTSFSHELRTPLTLILGPINDVIKSEKNKEKLEKLSMVRRNSNVLLELIDKMLEFRKTETEHNHLELGNYAFDDFVNAIHNNFSFYAEQKGIDFRCNANAPIELWYDHKKIQLVINNLLSNAFKYTPQNGEITIDIQDKTDWVVLSIEDSGPGIKKKALNSIFDLYFHSDQDDVVEGTGIGLALCKKLMELHGGKIKVESQFSKGAKFSIYLHKRKEHYEKMENVEFLNNNQYKISKPFVKSSTLGKRIATVEHIEKDDKVILVIDDNQDVVYYVSDILSDQYKIITAQNGKEGVKIALEYIPDLIISDIMMPVMSGTDLCEELKTQSQTSHIPIILLTAKLESENQLKSMNLGADAYITKPFDSQFLKARVENLFSNRLKLIKHYQLKSHQIKKGETGHDIVENNFLKKLENAVLEHFDGKDISIPELAANLGFSRSSLYRKVKAITGLSINQFARKVRLKQAAKLIDKGEMNVSQVAFEVGFNDMKYFRTCFKEQFGVLPSVYRKRKLERTDL